MLARVRIVEEIATKSVSGLGSCSRLAPTFPAPKPVRTKANLWSGMRTSRAVSSAASQSACDKAAAHLSSSCFFTVRLTVDTIAGEAWTSVEGPTCGVDGLLRGQRFMIGESPHEGVIDGRDQSAERADCTSTPPCRNVASSADCCVIELGGLLRVLHAHRVRVEHRALLPPNGIGRVVDLRTFAILLLDLPSWVKAHVQ